MTAIVRLRDGYTTTLNAASMITSEHGTTVLYSGAGQSGGIVAIVPKDALVIFGDD